MALHTVTLAGETDSIGFRREARALLAALVSPDEVSWQTSHPATDSLVAAAASRRASQAPTNLLLPRSFMSLCETVMLHNSPRRFGLLYGLLWRAVHEPGLMNNPLDADRVRVLHMAQAVRRDMQKMKNLIQFRTLQDEQGGALQLAWFQPEHHIVEAVAPAFARRLPQQTRWSILAPERSVRWTGEVLEFGPGVSAADAPARDAPAEGWLALYRSAFGAARFALPEEAAPR
jgi:DNA polymerase